jgi:hypothetical protein
MIRLAARSPTLIYLRYVPGNVLNLNKKKKSILTVQDVTEAVEEKVKQN